MKRIFLMLMVLLLALGGCGADSQAVVNDEIGISENFVFDEYAVQNACGGSISLANLVEIYGTDYQSTSYIACFPYYDQEFTIFEFAGGSKFLSYTSDANFNLTYDENSPYKTLDTSLVADLPLEDIEISAGVVMDKNFPTINGIKIGSNLAEITNSYTDFNWDTAQSPEFPISSNAKIYDLLISGAVDTTTELTPLYLYNFADYNSYDFAEGQIILSGETPIALLFNTTPSLENTIYNLDENENIASLSFGEVTALTLINEAENFKEDTVLIGDLTANVENANLLAQEYLANTPIDDLENQFKYAYWTLRNFDDTTEISTNELMQFYYFIDENIEKDIIDIESLLNTTYFAEVKENSFAEIEFSETENNYFLTNIYLYSINNIESHFIEGIVSLVDEYTLSGEFSSYDFACTANLFFSNGELHFDIIEILEDASFYTADRNLDLPTILTAKSDSDKPRIFFKEDVELPPTRIENLDNIIPNLEPTEIIADEDEEFGWYTLVYEDFSLKYLRILAEPTYYLSKFSSENTNYLPSIHGIKISDTKESVMGKFYAQDEPMPEFAYQTIDGQDELISYGETLFGEYMNASSYGRNTEYNSLFYTTEPNYWIEFFFDKNDILTKIEYTDSLFW